MKVFSKVLVTGGAGFIGSNYVQHIAQAHPEWSVVVLDSLSYAGSWLNLEGTTAKRIKGNICDPEAVANAMEGADAVLNFAAESHVDRSLQHVMPFVHSNIEGTAVLLAEAKKQGVKRFLQVSTDEVYGDTFGSTLHSQETDVLRPKSPYAASKAAAEHLVMSYALSFGLDAVITRGSNTYGPQQYPEKIIPLFILRALEGQPLPLYGNGSALRDYMHVQDHVRGIDHVLHHGTSGEAYNLGAHNQLSGLQVAAAILQALELPQSQISFVPDRAGHDYRYSIDPAKTHALGWSCQHSFAEGLRSTIQWYRQHAQRWQGGA